jgi:hypothetical protein
MSDFWQRLKQRKLAQWAAAYIAAAFALLQGIDIVAQQFGWPAGIKRALIIATCIGFFVARVRAWHLGEHGALHPVSCRMLRCRNRFGFGTRGIGA